MRHRLGLTIVILLAAPWTARGDEIVRRGDQPPLRGVLAGIDDGGPRIKPEGGAEVVTVPWDRVLAVRENATDVALDYREFAEDVWRARSRLERGDYALAAGTFERLFDRTLGQSHPTALVIAEGRLRCALHAGDHAAAVLPALEVARLRRRGLTCESYAEFPPVLDAETSLCPSLAPAWNDSYRLAPLERALGAYKARGDDTMAALARAYRDALRAQLGLAALPAPETPPSASGAVWIQSLLACERGDADARRRAREALREDLDDLPVWKRGWVYFALGRSLAREGGGADIQRAEVAFLHIASREVRPLAYLTGLGLAWTCTLADRAGDEYTRDIVASELERRYPRHPVLAADEPIRIDDYDAPASGPVPVETPSP